MSNEESVGRQPIPEEDEDAEMIDAEGDEDNDYEELEMGEQEESKTAEQAQDQFRQPRENRKDKDLNTFLDQMDKYAPIIPDAVTDYYLSLAGFECNDQRMYTAAHPT